MEGSETAPNAEPKGLYPGKPAGLFTGGQTPYENAELRLQTVHRGTFKLRAATLDPRHTGEDGRPATIEIECTVEAPASLRDRNDPPITRHDSLIVKYADKYGIPPQYIKSQVYEERGHRYDPEAFRYEPLGFDKKYVSTWGNADWAMHNYDFFQFPDGPGLSEDDRRQRERFRHIVNYHFEVPPPELPYECEVYDRNDPNVLLYDIVIANDGWAEGSYPWTLYNHARGPCGGIRQNWSKNALPDGRYLAYHKETFCCGSAADSPCTAEQQSLMEWLLNNTNYLAQTAVASSYGLLQVMYPTAVGPMEWREDKPAQDRDPALLFDPATSLDLGAGYDAKNIKVAFKTNSSPSWSTLLDYQKALVVGFNMYNPKKKEYQQGLHVRQGYRFRPN